MESLKDYDSKAQEYIINMGLFMYGKSKDFFIKELTEETLLKQYNNDYDEQKFQKEKQEIHDIFIKRESEIRELTENQYKEYDLLRSKIESEQREHIDFLKDTLNNAKKDKETLTMNLNMLVKDKVENETKYLSDKITELETKNNEYYKRYEKQTKGKYYETDLLMPAFEEYNDKHLDNRWEITHVGDVARKTDFIFKDKHTKKMVMIDSKNNNERKVGTTDMEKFRRDIFHELSFAVGGIMIANGKIGTKKSYELNEDGGKILIYISNFHLENVGMIFSQLDIIIDLTTNNSESAFTSEVLKRNMKEYYKNDLAIFHNIERQKKQIDKNLITLATNYNQMFNEDILIAIKEEDVKEIVEDGKEKWIKENLCMELSEEMSAGRIKKGTISEFVLYYEVDNKKYVHYFKTDASRKTKITQLYNSCKVRNETSIENIQFVDENIKVDI